jgi:hypothetical protein
LDEQIELFYERHTSEIELLLAIKEAAKHLHTQLRDLFAALEDAEKAAKEANQ